MRAGFEGDARPFLASVHVPTLVLHREGNRYIRIGAGRYIADHIDGAKFVALPGDDHLWFAGDSDALLDEVEEFLTGSHQAAEGDVTLATILFTDIVESTSHAARLGPRPWSKLTDEHDAVVRAALQRHRGREIKTLGDGFLATFNGGASAVRCASEIVTGAKAVGLDVRAGLHTGEIERRGDDIGGLAVTIAQRVCDLAGPTQVLVSETVKGLLVGTPIRLSDHGTHALKGVPDQWRLFAVAD
jgi:class 3 adenylate cyclase